MIKICHRCEDRFLGADKEGKVEVNEASLTVGTSTKWGLAIVAIIGALSAIAAAVGVYARAKADPAKIELPAMARAW